VKATLADNRGMVTITDDDEPPALSLEDISILEGNTGTQTAQFTLNLTTANGTWVRVNYATADGGIPISVELTQVTETQYQGYFEITETTPEGTAYAVFSARDKAGNRGTYIEAGASIKIDSQGPIVTQLTLSPAEPIRNDQSNPVTAQVSIELEQALLADNIPELSYRLSGPNRQPQAITPLTQTSDLLWSASFSLPADAGLNETETLQFDFRAEDDLQNVGTQIEGNNNFQIYQGELPPLWVPLGFVGVALPEGRIHLTWKAVSEATDYQLFRQAPGETDLSVYQRSNGALEFTDATTEDGLYRYAVASIRVANEQEGISAYGSIVTVKADSVVPDTPMNLQLEVVGAGIRALWEASTSAEPLTYDLYRATEEIQSVSELAPIKTEIGVRSVLRNENLTITLSIYK
jgi:hypothetical protein